MEDAHIISLFKGVFGFGTLSFCVIVIVIQGRVRFFAADHVQGSSCSRCSFSSIDPFNSSSVANPSLLVQLIVPDDGRKRQEQLNEGASMRVFGTFSDPLFFFFFFFTTLSSFSVGSGCSQEHTTHQICARPTSAFLQSSTGQCCGFSVGAWGELRVGCDSIRVVINGCHDCGFPFPSRAPGADRTQHHSALGASH